MDPSQAMLQWRFKDSDFHSQVYDPLRFSNEAPLDVIHDELGSHIDFGAEDLSGRPFGYI
jgi:hypothetical protein